MKIPKDTDKGSDLRASALITVRRQLQATLLATLAQMRAVHSAVTTAAFALEAQAADMDVDIAHALRCGAVNPLTEELERLERLVKAFCGEAPFLTEPPLIEEVHAGEELDDRPRMH